MTASIVLSIPRTGPRAVASRARKGRGCWRRAAFGDAQWRNQHRCYPGVTAGRALSSLAVFECPRQDSNLRSRLRRTMLFMAPTCQNTPWPPSLGSVWGGPRLGDPFDAN
jgi:hypothetical protein